MFHSSYAFYALPLLCFFISAALLSLLYDHLPLSWPGCLEHCLSQAGIFTVVPCHVHCSMESFSFWIFIQWLSFLHSWRELHPLSCLCFVLPSFALSASPKMNLWKDTKKSQSLSLPQPPLASHAQKNEYFLLPALHVCWKLSLRDAVCYIFICFLSFWFISTNTFQGRANVIYAPDSVYRWERDTEAENEALLAALQAVNCH